LCKISISIRNIEIIASYQAVSLLRMLVAGLSLRRPGFDFRLLNVGFVVVEVALGQVSVQVPRSPVGIIRPMFHTNLSQTLYNRSN
jgi:hypothetical protein